MKGKEAAEKILAELAQKFSSREAEQLAAILLEDLEGITSLQSAKEITNAEGLMSAVKEVIADRPIQYVTGVADFYGEKFFVNPHVLIPRPETEELVRWILEDIGHKKKLLDLVDIGLGSGCIAITLAKKLKSLRATGVEVSMDALNVARINSRRHNVLVSFAYLDFTDRSYWDALGVYDIIVSNPPYILDNDRDLMSPNVLEHEPDLALFIGDDPMKFYREIKAFAVDHLSPGGTIYMEIHEKMSEEIFALFEGDHVEVTLRQDMQGKDRMVRVKQLATT